MSTPPAVKNQPLRVGVVAFLNMEPLVAGLDRLDPARIEVVGAAPSRLADELEAGRIDVGMVPVAALFDHPEWRVAGRSMIGAEGPVLSVLVGGPDPIESWRALRPDPCSRTSNALARLLLPGVVGRELAAGAPLPEGWTPAAAGAPAAGDEPAGHVMIGSRALRWRRHFPVTLDLTELWGRATGLPFVCALWCARPGVELGDLAERLESLKRANMERIDELAAGWPGLEHDRLTPGEAAHYLRHHLRYDFTNRHRVAVERFYAEGLAAGLFQPGWSFRAA